MQTFRRITLPTIKWALAYGVVLSLARSLGEFGAVKVVSGNVSVGQTADRHAASSTSAAEHFEPGGLPAVVRARSLIAVALPSSLVSLLRPKEGRAR